MFIIPDNVLDTLICRNCKNYLSARPVKVYPNRYILCGRCSTDNDNGVVSTYDALAQQGLFRCINRYEGCDKLLRYTEVIKHEETCESYHYKCPLCPNAENIGSLAFLHHFRESHKSNILLSPTFEVAKVGRKLSKTFLYVNHYIFLVNIVVFRAVDHTQFIALNSVLLGSRSISDKVCQKYIIHTLHNGEKINKHVTKRTFCSPYCTRLKNKIIIANYDVEIYQSIVVDFEMDIRNAQTLITIPALELLTSNDNGNSHIDTVLAPGPSGVQTSKKKIKICKTNEFERMWSSKYRLNEKGTSILSLNRKIGFCCFCQSMFLSQSENHGIYKCLCTQCSNSNNLLCSKCFFFGIILCINGNGKPYSFAVEETAVFKTIQYYCHWGCGQKFYSWCLKLHEMDCSLQTEQLCPVKGCVQKYRIIELIKHIQEHLGVIFHNDNLIPTSILSKGEKNCVVVPVRNHFITITLDKILLNTFSCSLFNNKNQSLGNLQPMACFKRNKRVDSYDNLFTVDTEDDNEILIILADST